MNETPICDDYADGYFIQGVALNSFTGFCPAITLIQPLPFQFLIKSYIQLNIFIYLRKMQPMHKNPLILIVIPFFETATRISPQHFDNIVKTNTPLPNSSSQ